MRVAESSRGLRIFYSTFNLEAVLFELTQTCRPAVKYLVTAELDDPIAVVWFEAQCFKRDDSCLSYQISLYPPLFLHSNVSIGNAKMTFDDIIVTKGNAQTVSHGGSEVI
jgi:hypothetical protein